MNPGPAGVIFVSDIHLRHGDTPYLDQFLALLRAAPRFAREVYIHGDLFDFWVGARQGRLPFYRPLFDTLATLVNSGTPVTLLHGNRDYLAGHCFTDAGVTLGADTIHLKLGTSRVRLSHGDEYCIEDLSYQRARRVLRTGFMLGFVRALPVTISLLLARGYRVVSRRKARRLQHRGTTRLGSVFPGVRQALASDPADIVICGHIHCLASTPITHPTGTATLLTTGAWEESPNFVFWDGTTFSLRRFDPATGESHAVSPEVTGHTASK